MTPGVPMSAHLRCSSEAGTLSEQTDHGFKLQAVLDQGSSLHASSPFAGRSDEGI